MNPSHKNYIAVGASFFCPGLGQFVLGRWVRGVLMLALFIGSFLLIGSTVVQAFKPHVQFLMELISTGSLAETTTDPAVAESSGWSMLGVGGLGFAIGIGAWVWSLIDAWFGIVPANAEPASVATAHGPAHPGPAQTGRNVVHLHPPSAADESAADGDRLPPKQ